MPGKRAFRNVDEGQGASRRESWRSADDPRMAPLGRRPWRSCFLKVEHKRVPDHVLRDAERLECLLFTGYAPYFEGDEPPGL